MSREEMIEAFVRENGVNCLPDPRPQYRLDEVKVFRPTLVHHVGPSNGSSWRRRSRKRK